MALKEIAFLLLLDYSGSMEQINPESAGQAQVKNQTKITVMKKNIGNLLSSTLPQQQSHAIVFGSRPKKSCDDLQISRGPSKDLNKYLQELKPGPFGKTPLAKGLDQLLSRALVENVKSVVAITDGADSCGLDPCAVLKKNDILFKDSSKKIKMILVAYDVKAQAAKFQCFKDLKLSNIDLKIVEAQDSAKLFDALKEAKKASLGKSENSEDLNNTDALNRKKSKTTSSSGGNGSATDKNSLSKNGKEVKVTRSPFSDPTLCILEVIGAPSTESFQLENSKEKRNWLGSMPIEIAKGEYQLSDITENAKISLECPGGESIKIPWASLLDRSKIALDMPDQLLSVAFTPLPKTREMHGDVSEFKKRSDFSENPESVDVPFGEWEIKIESPEWFKGRVVPLKVNLVRNQDTSINLMELFKEQIRVEVNPSPDRDSVLKITYKDGTEERHLVTKGQKMVPIPKECKAEFILP